MLISMQLNLLNCGPTKLTQTEDIYRLDTFDAEEMFINLCGLNNNNNKTPDIRHINGPQRTPSTAPSANTQLKDTFEYLATIIDKLLFIY
jgi:hypothetical protein